jgi:hypothetical protein
VKGHSTAYRCFSYVFSEDWNVLMLNGNVFRALGAGSVPATRSTIPPLRDDIALLDRPRAGR